jgi:hypothetical protein
MTPKTRAARVELYRRVYQDFQAPVSRFDCGRKCAPHNGGEPVCCSTDHAIPIADKAEFELLRSRTDLWRRYTPNDAAARREVAGMHRDCVAIECKGARHCERDNRTMACRAFPFFPYMTRAGEIVGLAYFWAFEDRCWVISNLAVVTTDFVRECIAAYEAVFAVDRLEYETNLRLSADMRRVFARTERIIPVIGRDGGTYAVEPRSHHLRPATPAEFPKFGPYTDEAPEAVAAE